MTVVKWNVRPGAYYDLVVLMQLQRGLLELNGITDAGVVMATQANRDLLSANNLLPESVTANPDDLLIVVKADDDFLPRTRLGKWMNYWHAENPLLLHRIFVHVA